MPNENHDKKTGQDKEKGPVKKKDIPNNPDPKIDQDFPGYPHLPSSEKIIKPETNKEKKEAGIDKKDGEKINIDKEERESFKDDGSANAFERTERPQEEED